MDSRPIFSSINLPSRLNFIGVTEQASEKERVAARSRDGGGKLKERDPNETTADESNHFI